MAGALLVAWGGSGGAAPHATSHAGGRSTAAGHGARSGGKAATGAPVVLGDICSCTGPEASTISQTTPTMQAWAKWVDTHGGLDGHRVQLIVKDDGYNPANALSAAKSLVEVSHVVAIFDNSDEDPAFAPYVQQAGIPVLGGQQTDSGYKNPDFFPAGASFNYTTAVGAIVAKRAGVKTMAYLYCVEVAICKESTLQSAQVGKKYGIKTTYTAGIGFAAPTYTAQCLAAKDSGAKAMTVGDASAIVAKVVKDCAAQGYTPTQFSSDGTVSLAWLEIPALEGNIDTEANLPWFVHDSATKAMYTALHRYAPAVPKSPNFGEVVVQSWADGLLLQAAVDASHRSSRITPAGIKAGLYALPKGTTLGGLTPPLHFVKGQPANNPCFFVMGIKHHAFVQLDARSLEPLKNGSGTRSQLVCAPKTKAGVLSSGT